VRGLSGGDEVHALAGQCRCLGGSRQTSEIRERLQQAFPGLTHLGIGLDTENRVTIFQQQARPNAGAGGDVGDYVIPVRGRTRSARPEEPAEDIPAGRERSLRHDRRIDW